MIKMCVNVCVYEVVITDWFMCDREWLIDDFVLYILKDFMLLDIEKN